MQTDGLKINREEGEALEYAEIESAHVNVMEKWQTTITTWHGSHWDSDRSGLGLKCDVLMQRHERNQALLLSNAVLKLWNGYQLSQSLL